MERLEEAALAVINPTVTPSTRSAASKFLEEWNETDESWTSYPVWLSSNNSTGTKLLSLQLLQTKIRKQLPYRPNPIPSFLQNIQTALESIANSAVGQASAVQKPCCICLTALMVRILPTPSLCTNLLVSLHPISLNILQNVPLELNCVSELTSSAVAAELQAVSGEVLVSLSGLVQRQDVSAIAALRHWVEIARISPSQLAATSVLPVLLPCLSSATIDTQHAALALQESILVPTDSCTESRDVACSLIASSVLQWDYDPIWTGQLLSTFCTEEIDSLIVEPAAELLQLLLKLQRHPEIAVRTSILEVWLTVSQKAVQERHENWKKPLSHQIALAILETVSMDEDPDDRDSYRGLVGDVLETCYYMLGSDFFNMMVSAIALSPGPAMFCLSVVASEAVSSDMSLLQHQNLPIANLPPCPEKALYLGSYARLWAKTCSTSDIFTLLQYLGQAQAAKPIQAILVRCSKAINREPEQRDHCIRWLSEAALRINEDDEGESLSLIIQGCARTGVNVRTTMIPVIKEFTTRQTPRTIEQAMLALQVMLQFGEDPNSIAEEVVPFLLRVSDQASRFQSEVYWERWLDLEQQVIKSAPEVATKNLDRTMKRVMGAFSETQHSSCLDYVAVAVESLGRSNADSFTQLMDHISTTVFATLAKHGPISLAPLVKSYFELSQRYLLFCPLALAGSSQFCAILQCAVHCLGACCGEKESSRSILNFLTKMYCWKTLPVGAELQKYPLIERELPLHGEKIVSLCIATLLTGPQALSSPSTDCIVAVVANADPAMGQAWMQGACRECQNDLSRDVIELLLRLTQSGSKPRAKMLLMDFSMIHKGSLSRDALIGYSL